MRLLARRATALALSWIFTATTVWASAPPLILVAPDEPAADDVTSDDVAAAKVTPAPSCQTSFFGPRRYTRTTGEPDAFEETVAVPPWVLSPYVLTIQNGEADGRNRVSSATVEVNGVQVVRPSDLNQNVPGLAREVALTPTTALRVSLASAPESFLTLNLCGTFADRTPPAVAWTQPPAFTNDSTPALVVAYEDAAGAGEPAASGIDTASLAVLLDGVDRTALFVVRPGDASAEPDAPLADGTHQLEARISDLAGNAGEGRTTFTVDVTPPTASIELPDALTNAPAPQLRAVYSDATSGVDPATVAAWLDGQAVTSLVAGATEATAVLATDPPLADGEHEIRLALQDRAGNPQTVTKKFRLDTRPPTAAVLAPTPGGFTNDRTPDVRVSYADPEGSGVVPGSVRLFVRKAADPPAAEVELPAVQAGPNEATVVVPEAMALAEAEYRLRVALADAAGNAGATESGFTVDTESPHYAFESPAAGRWLATRTPAFSIRLEEGSSGIDTARFGFAVDGKDLTARFTVDATSAKGALLPEDALAEGAHSATVVVFDRAGNAATTSGPVPFPFSVDVTPPGHAVVLPAPDSYVGTPADRLRLEYADGGSGIAPGSVDVKIDGAAPSRDGWSVTASATEGPLAPPVGDGHHQLAASVRDAAGNATPVSAAFTVDTEPPVVTLESPAAGSYHKASPVTLTGTVVDTDPQVTVRCLREGAEAPATVEGTAFTCMLPLAEGPNEVRAEGKDRLARVGASEPRTLHLDTAPPEIEFKNPSPGSAVTGTTVDVTGEVHDPSPIVSVHVAGREAQLSGTTFTATAVPIGDGPDVSLAAEAEDAAGNVGRATLQLVVDRQAPVVLISRPQAEAYVRGPVLEVEGTVTDQSDVTVEVNGVPEDPPASLRAPRSFRARVPITDAPTTAIVATAIDAAGNRGTAQVDVHVDSTPPEVTIDAPADGHITKEPSVLVTGTVTDLSPIDSFQVNGVAAPLGPGGSFQVEVPLPDETTVEIRAEAVDHAGNVGAGRVAVTVDRTPPQVTVRGPARDAMLGSSSVTVDGTVVEPHLESLTVDGHPATATDQAWQVIVGGLSEGSHTFDVRAADKAGNLTALPWPVTIDLSAPEVVITSPAGGAVRDATVTVAGTVRDRSLEALAVNGAPATWVGDPTGPAGATFSVPGVPLVDQQDNSITVEARDSFQRTGSAGVQVFRDSLAPVIESFTTPPRLVRGQPATASADVSDGAGTGVATVVFFVNGQEKVRLTSPPWQFSLEVPEGVGNGETFAVAVQASDRLDNASVPVSHDIVVSSQGVVVGFVLADETGRPLPGATVRMVSGGAGGGAATSTDEAGRYSLPAESATAVLVAEAAGRTSVERELPVESGVGTVPVDARLLPLAAAVPVPTTGATLAIGAAAEPPSGTVGVSVEVPQGAFSGPVQLRLTPLTSQGLPNLLPLGFSPVVAFDLREDGGASTGAPLPATVTGLADVASPLHLVTYKASVHAWVVATPGVALVDGTASFVLPSLGAYALVSADTGEPAIEIPDPGEPLAGVAMTAIPPTVTSEGVVDPSVLPPTGGRAEGTLVLTSPLPLPSGTVVKGEVTETYTLSSQEQASEEKRSHDIVLYRGPTAHGLRLTPCAAKDAGAMALCAAFPITPARTFEEGELVEGKVHLDILAGREGVRGKVGGSEPVKVDSADGQASVFVPGQALPRDTAISVETSPLSTYLPSGDGIVALSELVVDFSGQTLDLGAELSVVSPGVAAGETVLLARVERVDGIPRLEVVALGRVETDAGGVERLVSEPFAGLAGVTEGGRYVFYRLASPVGFVTGHVQQLGAGVSGVVVTTAGLPFVGMSRGAGAYAIAALPGEVTLTARKPKTALQGQAAVLVEAVPAPAAVRDILLDETATIAAIVPADGSRDVPVTQQMELRSPTALQPATVTTDHVRLWRLEGATETAVPVRLIQSGSGRTVAIVPEARLAYEATYRAEAVELLDVRGADVVVSPSVFTTRKEIPPAAHHERLVFTFPDERGLVTVSGPGKTEAPPDGTYEAGTEILIIDASNGFVLTLTAGNDNEVAPTEFPATINDRLMITVTDPYGNTTSFQRSQFVNPETGETAIGPGGGVVTGPGGVEARIPEGALEKGAVLKITGLTPEALEAELGDDKVPDIPGAQLGSGIRIDAPAKPNFKKEVDLVFPMPADVLSATGAEGKTPEDAFFYVYRRVEGPNGAVFFQTLDYAQVECPGGVATCADGEKKLVTASFPFLGFEDVGATWAGEALTTLHAYLMWSFDFLLPGQPTLGTITGRVARPSWPTGATNPVYVGVPGAKVWGMDASGVDLVKNPDPTAPPETVAYADGNGYFTFFDRRFMTGTVVVKAEVGGVEYQGTAYAVQVTDTKALQNPAIAALAKAGRFTQVATVEIVVPALEEPPPPPAVAIHVMRFVDGKRTEANGIVTTGTPLLFGFKSTRNLEVTGAEVDGQQLEVVPEDLVGTTPGSPLAMDKLGRDAGSADGLYRPHDTGRQRIQVVARPVTGDLAGVVRFEASFLVVEGGEGNRTTREGESPGVISAVPSSGAGGVPVSVLPQLVFSEPVVNVPAGVFLEEIQQVMDTIPVTLTGVRPDDSVVEVVGPADAVVSVTLRPQRGLKFKAEYRLRVTGAVQDLDTTPRGLEPEYTSTFTTFGPEDLEAESERFSSAGLAILGDRLYMLETAYAGGAASAQQYGYLRTFDVSDPVEPREVAEKELINFPPRDVAGDGERLAVVTGSRLFYTYTGDVRELMSTPGNLLLYDVSGDKPQWSGGASLVSSNVEGYANRVAVKEATAYVAVSHKGIQVVDLDMAKAAFDASNPSLVMQEMSKPGGRFAPEAVKTIAVSDPSQPYSAMLVDLKVADMAWLGEAKRLVFATGSSKALGLVVADPSRLSVVSQRPDGQAGGMVVEKGTSSLDWGSAVAVGVVQSRPLVLVGGAGKLDGAAAAGLVAILDLTPMANRPPPGSPTPKPEVLAFVAVPGIPGDILIYGTTAIVSSWTGTESEEGSGLATLIDLTDPANARVIGTLTGVGSRLALGPDNILFSTDRTFLKGTPTDLDGVQSAALANTALIEGTDPRILVVGEGPRVAEPFRLKYRVIPKDFEVRTARIEFRVDQGTHSTIEPVPMAEGRGEVTLPFGFTIPRVGQVVSRPRLVLNAGTPDELASGLKAWQLSPVEVAFVWADKDVPEGSPIEPKDEEVTADLPEIDVEAVSEEWYRRFEEGTDSSQYQMVSWQALSPPARTRAGSTLSNDGFFETVLETGTAAGQERQVVARLKDVVLGTTDPLAVEPGLAAEAQSRVTLERSAIPADGASTTLLTLDAKDQYGNAVADGTTVVWEKAEDADGEFLEAQETTQSGKATVKYRAGTTTGLKTLRAHVDDAVVQVTIDQAQIGLVLVAPEKVRYGRYSPPVELTLEATCPAGPVSKDAQIGWFSSIGRVEQTQPLQEGIAKARWHFGALSHRPKVLFVATLGSGRQQRTMVWERVGWVSDARPRQGQVRLAGRRVDGALPGGGAALQAEPPAPERMTAVEPLMMAGDLTQDGYIPLERADGTTEQVFVKASATYRATGLVPGERVTVRLGTNRAPNIPPVAHYTGESIVDGLVPDAMGGHDGKVTGGVTLVEPGERGQGYALDGTGVIKVTHDEEFEFAGGFMVQTAVRPPPSVPAPEIGTGEPPSGPVIGAAGANALVDKAGQFRLDLVRVSGDLRVRFIVQTTTGEESVVSAVPVPVESWSILTGRYDSGRLWIGVDTDSSHADDFTYLSGAPVHSTQDIQIGPNFAGQMDEIRIYDLTRTPLSTFPSGETSISFVADGTGTFEMPIVSTGQLGVGRVAQYYRTLAREALTQSDGEPPPTTLQEGLGSELIEAESFWEDTAERATTPYGYCGAVLMGSMVKFARGILVGSEPGEIDLAVMAGDIAGSIFLSPVAILRDMANSTERLINANPSGDDALNLAMGLVTIASALTKGKLGAFLQIGKLAKALPVGSRASRATARIIALEAKLAGGAAGVSRVEKLIQVAQLSSTASQMVGGVLDAVGVHIEAVEAFNRIMSNAPEEEQPGVLEEMASTPDEMPDEDFRLIVRAAGEPLPEDTNALFAAGPLPPRYIQITRKALKGMKRARRVVEEGPLKRTAKTVANKIRRNHGGNAKQVFEEIEDLLGVPQLHRVVRQLGYKKSAFVAGARRLLSVARDIKDPKTAKALLARIKVPTSAVVKELESRTNVDFLARAGGRIRARVYDLVLEVGNSRYYCEIKHWARFPPNKEALKAARDQLRRDIVKHLTDPAGEFELERLRWILPADLDQQKGQILVYFQDVVGSASVRAALRRSPRYATMSEKLFEAEIANTKKLLETVFQFVD